MELRSLDFANPENLNYQFLKISTRPLDAPNEIIDIFYFKAKDIATLLEYDNTRQAIRGNVGAANKFLWGDLTQIHEELRNIETPTYFVRNPIIINTDGLFELIINSDKPIAIQFHRYIFDQFFLMLKGNHENQYRLLNDKFDKLQSIYNQLKEISQNRFEEISQNGNMALQMSSERIQDIEKLAVVQVHDNSLQPMIEVYRNKKPFKTTYLYKSSKKRFYLHRYSHDMYKFQFIRAQKRSIKQERKRIDMNENNLIYQKYNVNNAINPLHSLKKLLKDENIEFGKYYADFDIPTSFPFNETIEKIMNSPKESDKKNEIEFYKNKFRMLQDEPMDIESLALPTTNAILFH